MNLTRVKLKINPPYFGIFYKYGGFMDMSKFVLSFSDEELAQLSIAVWKERLQRFDISKYPSLTEIEKNIYFNNGKIKTIIAYKIRTKLDSHTCQMMVEKSMEPT
jgi:hypothetical protein